MSKAILVGLGGAVVLAGAALGAAPADAATLSRTCMVDQVAVIDGRMHIKCAPNAGEAVTKDIRYFAMPLSEPQIKIDNLIALAVAAKQVNRPMVIWYDHEDYKSVPGCQGVDCRRLKGAGIE
jgi:hypothetical protein